MGLKNTKNQKTRIPNEVFRLVEAVNFGLWMYEMSSIQKHAPRLAVMQEEPVYNTSSTQDGNYGRQGAEKFCLYHQQYSISKLNLTQIIRSFRPRRQSSCDYLSGGFSAETG